MPHKRKTRPGMSGHSENEQQSFEITNLIIPQIAPNCQKPQKPNLAELDESLSICHEWLAHLFTSDDGDDAWRLADVWPEYLRQRALWSEVYNDVCQS